MKMNLSELKAPHKKDRDTTKLESLIESIKEIGIIEPIVINSRNEIISGRRRYYAAKHLQLHKVDVIYYEKSAIDMALASIDANLMSLPLGNGVDYDEALSARKKLYEQKYPATRQYVRSVGGEAKAFTEDAAGALDVSRRSVELAIARAEKSSPMVTSARREGKLSPTIVNELVKLPKSYQDKILSSVEGKSVAEVKSIVGNALSKDADYAVKKLSSVYPLENVDKNMKKLKASLMDSFKVKFKGDFIKTKDMLQKADEIISLLEKFIEVNTPVSKPILRKAHAVAS